MSDVFDIKQFSTPEKCSLYRAVRYIAFNERPVPEDIAKYAYTDFENSHQTLQEHSKSQEFSKAIKVLKIGFISRKIKMYGMKTKNYEESIIQSRKVKYKPLIPGSSPLELLPKKLGKNQICDSAVKMYIDCINFYENTITTELLNYEYGAMYEALCVSSAELFSFIPPSQMRLKEKTSEQDISDTPCTNISSSIIENKNKDIESDSINITPPLERRGRKAVYDWNEFQVQIVLIANSIDGLPETQSELEKIMADWCSDNWNKIPGESTIREKISPIYQKLKEARK